jgi:hypothetical protein
MDWEFKLGLMERDMRVLILLKPCIKENGLIIRLQVKADLHMQMEMYMKGNGNWIKLMVTESTII